MGLLDWLKGKAQPYRVAVDSPAGRLMLAKDAVKVGADGADLIDRHFNVPGGIANRLENTFGPASPKMINAYDAVANNTVTKWAVKKAAIEQGGRLTLALTGGIGAGKFLNSRLKIDKVIADD